MILYFIKIFYFDYKKIIFLFHLANLKKKKFVHAIHIGPVLESGRHKAK